MTVKNYTDLPSSAIQSIVIDSNTGKVEVTYKSSNKTYTYSSEDVGSFDQQLLSEFDSDDISIGRFLNQSISSGDLKLLVD